MIYDGSERRRSIGRRDYDRSESCPFHLVHNGQITELIQCTKILKEDMKKKIGITAAAVLMTVLIGVLTIAYFAIDRYVESTTSSAVNLLRKHIETSEKQMEKTVESLNRLEMSNRVILYRLDRLDKSPNGSGNKGVFKPEI